jgi:hypothetical protein
MLLVLGRLVARAEELDVRDGQVEPAGVEVRLALQGGIECDDGFVVFLLAVELVAFLDLAPCSDFIAATDGAQEHHTGECDTGFGQPEGHRVTDHSKTPYGIQQ